MSVEASQPALPYRTACPGCDEVVLVAATRRGREVVLDRHEMLPRQRCPACLSVRLRDYSVPCWRCNDTQMIGESLKQPGLWALDADGVLAKLPASGARAGFVAVHRAHACAGALALAG